MKYFIICRFLTTEDPLRIENEIANDVEGEMWSSLICISSCDDNFDIMYERSIVDDDDAVGIDDGDDDDNDIYERNIYTCNICEKTYARYVGLMRHISNAHIYEKPKRIEQEEKVMIKEEEEPSTCEIVYYCELCENQFDKDENLKLHIKHNHKGNNLKCKLCQDQMPNLQALRLHMTSHKYKYSCDLCEEKYDDKKSLQQHVMYHHILEDSQYITCDMCKKLYKRSYYENVHKKAHLPEKIYLNVNKHLTFHFEDNCKNTSKNITNRFFLRRKDIRFLQNDYNTTLYHLPI